MFLTTRFKNNKEWIKHTGYGKESFHVLTICSGELFNLRFWIHLYTKSMVNNFRTMTEDVWLLDSLLTALADSWLHWFTKWLLSKVWSLGSMSSWDVGCTWDSETISRGTFSWIDSSSELVLSWNLQRFIDNLSGVIPLS